MKTDKEKELDNLFREGFENPGRNANFREDDWDALEAMLDNGKKRAGILYWLPIIGGIAAMLLLALGWVLLKPHHTGHVLVKNDTATHKFPINQQVHLKREDTATKHTPLNNNAASVVNTDEHGSTKLGHKAHTTKTLSAQYARNYPTKNQKAGNLAPHLTENKSESPYYYNSVQAGDNFLNSNILAANIAALNLSGFIDTVTGKQKASPKLIEPQIASAPVKDKKTIKKSGSFRPQFAITVLAAPDINGVNSFQNSKVGTNVGLLFSVGITKKFTISTGASYSKKPYLTSFDNYHTTYNFKVDPENVSADCRVLDIPININYQVYNKSRNKFAIGTGLSSYLMLRENYHFNYEYPNTPGPVDYNITNKNKHFLGVLNFNASYYRQLNSKISIGVEPYLKIPLTNIGQSQVKLQTTGLAVGVTWNIFSPHKP